MGNPSRRRPIPSAPYLPKPTRFDQRFTDSSLCVQPFAQSLDTLTHTFAVFLAWVYSCASLFLCVKTAPGC